MRQSPQVVAQTGSPDEGRGFAGSWSLTVFEEEGPPTRALYTLGGGGTLVVAEHPVVTPPDAPGPIFTSSGHGAWSASAPDEAHFTYLAFGSASDGQLFTVVTFHGSLALGVDGATLKGEMTARIDDPQGNTMATFPLRLEGMRIIAKSSAVRE